MNDIILSPIPLKDLRAMIADCVNSCLQQTNDVNTQNPEADKLLTIQQAAEFLSLTVPTMYGKVSKNELPFMKRGKRLYFSRDELIQYLKSGRKKSNAEIEVEANTYLKKRR